MTCGRMPLLTNEEDLMCPRVRNDNPFSAGFREQHWEVLDINVETHIFPHTNSGDKSFNVFPSNLNPMQFCNN